jgi:hypothetical protein
LSVHIENVDISAEICSVKQSIPQHGILLSEYCTTAEVSVLSMQTAKTFTFEAPEVGSNQIYLHKLA